MRHFLSLGAGVQSSTLALMAAAGEIGPMPEAAIFADTQAEPPSVYRWLDWLEAQLPFPVIRATYGDLAADNLKVQRSRKSGKVYSKSLVPVFILRPDGKKGTLGRRCTRDYKIMVIQREVKRLLGLRRAPSGGSPLSTQWIGISIDEAHRMKPSGVSWYENRWPLIEAGISRSACLRWMAERGYPTPPRSACTFCPYHGDAEWHRLKTEEPEAFAQAVAWEEAYQRSVARCEVTKGVPFLHESLIPLRDVTFDLTKRKADQFGNECEGMCGV